MHIIKIEDFDINTQTRTMKRKNAMIYYKNGIFTTIYNYVNPLLYDL